MHRFITVLACLLLLVGCGFGGRDEPAAPAVAYANEPVSDVDWASSRRGSYREPNPDATALEAELHGAYVVAPDRALVRVSVRAEAADRGATAQRIREAADRLAATLDDGGACRAEVVDYGLPERGVDDWSGHATIRYDVALRGLETVVERFARVESCMGRFSAIDASLGETHVAVSEPLVTVDDPATHRAALLQREVDARRALVGLEEVAGAPRARRCTTEGRVSITRRSLRGVVLALDLDCSRAPAVAVPGAAG